MSLDISLRSAADPTIELFEANITHNLSSMASDAGIYDHIWHPGAIHITKAGDLIKPLTNAIALLKEYPDRFKQLMHKTAGVHINSLCRGWKHTCKPVLNTLTL